MSKLSENVADYFDADYYLSNNADAPKQALNHSNIS